MNNKLKLMILLITVGGCVTGGTHGSIKTYEYEVSKYMLEEAVLKVINSNSNIQRDTANGYYNGSDNSYITIEISKGELVNDYTLRYGGNKEYWDTARRSSIFIAYAFDKEGNGGSEGDGGVTWYNVSLKSKLITLFESEFISKLDKELGVNHTESN